MVNGEILDVTEITDADGKIVLDAFGDYYITLCHNEDSYYTQAETVAINMNRYVNVTSLTTNNKTVNITAKSNIYNETMPGKLLFILPDTTQLVANYAGNGIWWAVHTFDEFDVYEVNGSYIGLDDVSITNATLNIAEIQANITLENETVELFAEDSIDAGAALDPAVAGTLTFTSSNETVAKVVDGKIIAVSEGIANITVSFAGSEGYLPALNRTITVTVNRVIARIVIGNITTYPGLDVNITVNVTLDDNVPFNDDINLTLPNGTVIPVKIINGGAVIPWTVPDNYYRNYSINATFEGNNRYLPSKGTGSLTVNKYESKVAISEITAVVYPNNVTIRYSVENRTNVTVTVDGVSDDKIIVENDVITVVGLIPGKYTIRIANNESNLYHGSGDAREFTVYKSESNVTISEITAVVYPNNVTIRYSVENRTNVTVTVDGVSQDKIIVENDTITVIGLDAGKYTIRIANNESDLYHGSGDAQNFTVNMNPSKIAASNISATYNINKNLLITLTDDNGNPLSGAKVTVNLNGAKEYTTDSNGQVKVPTKGLVPKTYSAKITFKGNNNYIGSSLGAKVTVNKAKPKIIAKKKKFKAKSKKKRFKITLKDNTGKPIKKVKVRLTLKKIVKKSKKTSKETSKKTSKKSKSKKKTIAKTNNKGRATFKLKVTKKGKYRAIIKFAGNKYYKAVTKKVKITVK